MDGHGHNMKSDVLEDLALVSSERVEERCTGVEVETAAPGLVVMEDDIIDHQMVDVEVVVPVPPQELPAGNNNGAAAISSNQQKEADEDAGTAKQEEVEQMEKILDQQFLSRNDSVSDMEYHDADAAQENAAGTEDDDAAGHNTDDFTTGSEADYNNAEDCFYEHEDEEAVPVEEQKKLDLVAAQDRKDLLHVHDPVAQAAEECKRTAQVDDNVKDDRCAELEVEMDVLPVVQVVKDGGTGTTGERNTSVVAEKQDDGDHNIVDAGGSESESDDGSPISPFVKCQEHTNSAFAAIMIEEPVGVHRGPPAGAGFEDEEDEDAAQQEHTRQEDGVGEVVRDHEIVEVSGEEREQFVEQQEQHVGVEAALTSAGGVEAEVVEEGHVDEDVAMMDDIEHTIDLFCQQNVNLNTDDDEDRAEGETNTAIADDGPHHPQLAHDRSQEQPRQVTAKDPAPKLPLPAAAVRTLSLCDLLSQAEPPARQQARPNLETSESPAVEVSFCEDQRAECGPLASSTAGTAPPAAPALPPRPPRPPHLWMAWRLNEDDGEDRGAPAAVPTSTSSAAGTITTTAPPDRDLEQRNKIKLTAIMWMDKSEQIKPFNVASLVEVIEYDDEMTSGGSTSSGVSEEEEDCSEPEQGGTGGRPPRVPGNANGGPRWMQSENTNTKKKNGDRSSKAKGGRVPVFQAGCLKVINGESYKFGYPAYDRLEIIVGNPGTHKPPKKHPIHYRRIFFGGRRLKPSGLQRSVGPQLLPLPGVEKRPPVPFLEVQIQMRRAHQVSAESWVEK
eukprot:g5192.t1